MSHEVLLTWFDELARPLLGAHVPERLASLDSDASRLRNLATESREFVVCVLGNAGIGKSTLLNALVAGDRTVLPAGGVGPLTAMATTIRFRERESFTVRYHEPKVLWQVVSTLMLALEKERKARPETGTDGVTGEDELFANGVLQPDLAGLPDEARAELTRNAVAAVTEAMPAPDDPSAADRPIAAATRFDSIVKQAKQLVTGDQYAVAELPYLVDCLRMALGRDPMYGARPLGEHADNVARITTALSYAGDGSPLHRENHDGHGDFNEDLRRHAAGHLAPLIREIEVGWPSPLLSTGLVFVDLPGVGVANDAYRNVTQEYVRDRARAVVVVVNRAGVTDAVLDLIRTSGYWDRLVGAAYEPEADPCALLIAVSGVDDVADEEWKKYSDAPKDRRPTKRSMFAEQSELLISRFKAQAAEQFAKINRVSENEAVNEARSGAAAQILEMLEVHPVSAPEYRRIIAEDEDDRPRMLRELDESGVPRLARTLERLTADATARLEARRQAVYDRLGRAIRDELTLIESQWKAEDRASAAAERLRQELEEFLPPVREQLSNRKGAFREFLQETVESRIDQLVLEARDVAERDVRSYLDGLRGCHWATLRAAVQRGGTYAGATHIDLPADISDYFQEPMAGVWGVKLLRLVRKRTKEYADDCVYFVDQVCDWARDQGARVKVELVDVQQKRVRSQAEQLHQVGKEASDELRNVVRSELHRAVAPSIRRKCENFVKRGDSVGTGVKRRILELFNDLAMEATRAAEEPARRILQTRFAEVREQIDQSFKDWGDPLQETVDAIASSHEQRLRRSDAQRRGKILAEIAKVQEAMPSELRLLSDAEHEESSASAEGAIA